MFNKLKKGLSGKKLVADIPDPTANEEGVWKDDSDCHLCGEGFTMTKRKHHCRKCGQVVCGDCGKNKIKLSRHATDMVRVCDTCFEKKDEKKETKGGDPMKIYPPVWVNPIGINDCFKCHRQPKGLLGMAAGGAKQLHHCRTCGRMFCSSCTKKIDVPAAFQGPKNKAGPARVCQICLMMLETGVELVNERPPEVADSYKAAGGGDSDDDGAPPPPGADEPAPAAAVAVAAPAQASMAASVLMKVCWENHPEGEDEDPAIAQIPCLENTSLAQMHTMVKRSSPDISNMESSKYKYVCEGEAISPAHFHVFEAKHFENQMVWVRYIKEERRMQRSASVANAAQSAIEAAKARAKKIQEEAKETRASARPTSYRPITKRDFVAASAMTKRANPLEMQQKIASSSGPKNAGLPPGLSAPPTIKKIFQERKVRKSVSESGGTLKGDALFQQRAAAKFGANLGTGATDVIALEGGGDSSLPPPPDGFMY